MERMFLIYSSYALSLEKFGISGGRRGAIDAFMLNLLLHFGIALADPCKNFIPTGSLGCWTFFHSLESLARA